MPKFFQVLDKLMRRKLTRKSLDVREMLGHDPARYEPLGDAKGLRPIVHPKMVVEEGEEYGEPEPVTAAAPPVAKVPAPPAAPAKKQPSQAAIQAKRAALAKGRATAAANRAAKAAQQQHAAE